MLAVVVYAGQVTLQPSKALCNGMLCDPAEHRLYKKRENSGARAHQLATHCVCALQSPCDLHARLDHVNSLLCVMHRIVCELLYASLGPHLL